MFPADFVEETMQVGFEPMDQIRREPSKPAPTPRTHTRKQSLYHSSSGGGDNDDPDDPVAAAALAAAEGDVDDSHVVDIVRALYDVDEQPEGDELTFKEGDLIEVYQKFEDGWWFGSIGNRKGYFPSNCVEVGVRVDDVSDGEDGNNAGGDGVAAGKVDIEIRTPGADENEERNAAVLVGTAVSAADSPAAISGQIAIPIPPPKDHKGIHKSPVHSSSGEASGKMPSANFGNGFVPEEDYSSHILVLKAVATLALLFAFSLMASAMFGPLRPLPRSHRTRCRMRRSCCLSPRFSKRRRAKSPWLMARMLAPRRRSRLSPVLQ